ncbi:hypothetical protein EPUS_05305 [Endocarpon pusillum Z07020]|uniref:Alcohol dehydrogenase-like N-terminal domain-containing protein n=1 Tax=Endocarpon pusillum (strain Z07020 / HMAS-L-300199) TaxID=1263415 RepID=U1GGM3_ENDPU|nr:uncharacterized protein EPUS_05305 [Endocarpon pusillum Z07020]ERF71253.1 hypothetical protein EPUS_05305 [Endocarpon pusillum Z07020]
MSATEVRSSGKVGEDSNMKAVNYQGPYKLKVEEVPNPTIEHPDDVIVKKPIAGRENMGVVDKLGSGVVQLKKGDRVVIPFNIGDGRCHNCVEGNTGFCLGANPGFAGAAYGYVALGPYRGGQAQYLQVPFADFNALKLPAGKEHDADFILLAEIFPTGWHDVKISGFQAGEIIAVFGARPVGLMASYSTSILGASKIYLVDRVPERLSAARKIPECMPIDFTQSDALYQIIEANDEMVDRSVDCVGYQAVDSSGEKEQPNIILENMIRVTRACGGMGIPGLYLPQDPGSSDEKGPKRQMLISFRKLFEKICRLLMSPLYLPWQEFVRQEPSE